MCKSTTLLFIVKLFKLLKSLGNHCMTLVAHLRFFGKQTEQFFSLNAGKGIYSFICFIM